VQLALVLRRVPPGVVTVVHLLDDPGRASRGGWAFDPAKGVSDPVFGAADLREVYDRATGSGDGGYLGRCTAPLLVDRETGRVVCNDSAQIVRMLGCAQEPAPGTTDCREVELVPADLRDEIEMTNAWTYALLSNAVYRSGFATTQEAFERAVNDVARGLERAERLLEGRRFLCGERVTEADVMLLPCAARFDAVYAFLFLRGSCGLWRERPSLQRWLQDCWSLPGVRNTIDVRSCQESYYGTLFPLNPSQIVPFPMAKSVGISGLEEVVEKTEVEELFYWRGA